MGWLLLKIRFILRKLLDAASRGEVLQHQYTILRSVVSTAHMHQKTFSRFKGIHTGQDIVVVANGPSVLQFRPIPNAIYIGVNMAVDVSTIKLNYLFFHDSLRTREQIDRLNHYKGNDCIKFYGLNSDLDEKYPWIVSESDCIEANALRYRLAWQPAMEIYDDYFPYDISSEPIAAFGSVIFSALQFALWTNPRRIYLVGCDCSSTGHFYDDRKEPPNGVATWTKGYRKLKEFASAYYPATEFISVNPVGLKGLFRDWYQSEEPCPPPRG